MNQIFVYNEQERILDTISKTILYCPITVDQLIKIIELSGEISKRGYNIENLLDYYLNHELSF